MGAVVGSSPGKGQLPLEWWIGRGRPIASENPGKTLKSFSIFVMERIYYCNEKSRENANFAELLSSFLGSEE
jgi:hypothetical protein